MRQLVLSLFPGIGLLDMAFEEEGFCVVRGPDLLWGGDVRKFHPPHGRFEGVIGGPPCQAFSQMRRIQPAAGKHGNLIPEYGRIVSEARPTWFVMENVKDAPLPNVAGYRVESFLLNNRWLGEEQHRLRRFSFGTANGARLQPFIDFAVFEASIFAPAVTTGQGAVPVALGGSGKRKASLRPPTITSGHGSVFSHERGNMQLAEMCRLQGLPGNFTDEMPFTAHGKRRVVGNGVPLPMGRAIARAVKEATKEQAA